MLSKVFSAAAQGVEATVVEVEVDLSNGLSFERPVTYRDLSLRATLAET